MVTTENILLILIMFVLAEHLLYLYFSFHTMHSEFSNKLICKKIGPLKSQKSLLVENGFLCTL